MVFQVNRAHTSWDMFYLGYRSMNLYQETGPSVFQRSHGSFSLSFTLKHKCSSTCTARYNTLNSVYVTSWSSGFEMQQHFNTFANKVHPFDVKLLHKWMFD